MANGYYDKGVDAAIRGNFSWTNDDIWIVAIDTAFYGADLAEHRTLADIPVQARVVQTAVLGRTTNGKATIDATDPVFENASGPTCEAVAFYKRVVDAEGDVIENQSLLWLYMDTAPGLPLILNGTSVDVALSDQGLARL